MTTYITLEEHVLGQGGEFRLVYAHDCAEELGLAFHALCIKPNLELTRAFKVTYRERRLPGSWP